MGKPRYERSAESFARWEREGRLAEVKAWLENQTNKGIDRREAMREAVAKYPPLDGSEVVAWVPPVPGKKKKKPSTRAEHVELRRRRRRALENAAWWAATHEDGDQAPNELAKTMMQAKVDDAGFFVKQILVRVLPVPSEDKQRATAEVARPWDDPGPGMEVCQEILRRMQQAAYGNGSPVEGPSLGAGPL
jgi:hypothetical protein